MGTRRGVIKKTHLSAFRNPRAGGIIAMAVEEGPLLFPSSSRPPRSRSSSARATGMAIRVHEN